MISSWLNAVLGGASSSSSSSSLLLPAPREARGTRARESRLLLLSWCCCSFKPPAADPALLTPVLAGHRSSTGGGRGAKGARGAWGAARDATLSIRDGLCLLERIRRLFGVVVGGSLKDEKEDKLVSE